MEAGTFGVPDDAGIVVMGSGGGGGVGRGGVRVGRHRWRRISVSDVKDWDRWIEMYEAIPGFWKWLLGNL